MKIVVYGLGIIGASLSASLRAAGHTVYGKNRSREAVKYALSHGIIDDEAENYENAEVVFLALPPDATMRELDEGDFPRGVIVADVCGVKRALEDAVYAKPRAYRYVGTHPMAGKETSGIQSASASLFLGANLILTTCGGTDPKALETVRCLGKEIGFGRITVCSAEEHDRKIALTSQLAHIVANAYAKSPETSGCAAFTGGSYQDMTRVAGVDENLWTELYFYNRASLLEETERLITRLCEYRDALREGDCGRMKELLHEGRIAREEYFSEK